MIPEFVKEVIENLADNCSAEYFTRYSEEDIITYLVTMAGGKIKIGGLYK